MRKQVTFKIKGMQKDLSVSAFNPEYAYDARNIRIMSTDDSTLYSIVNEIGPSECTPANLDHGIEGTPIGQAVIDDELIIFTTTGTGTKKDKIYKIWHNGHDLSGKQIYEGELGFNAKHPIETLSFYENQEFEFPQ